MPVKFLDAWSSSNNKSQTLPISALNGSILGIEADYYLERILTTAPSKEPLVIALGGFPFGLKNQIESDLDELRNAGITPLFVFSGCKTVREEEPFSRKDDRPARRALAWELYDQGKAQEAVEAFSTAGTTRPSEVYRYFQRVLRENSVKFQVAPYSAWPQLVYLEKKHYVDAICGTSELLMFDAEKVIVSLKIGSNSPTFSWVNKSKLLSDLNLTNDQFIDVCLLSGSEICRTFPALENGTTPLPQAFLNGVEMIRRFGTVGTVIGAHSEAIQKSGYFDKYRRARAAVKHHVIFTEEGKVEQLNFAESPCDVHEFVGHRLPEELYFYLSRGVIGPQALDMLVTGRLVELAPLDDGDSDEYRKFLNALNPLRTQTLSLLAQPLNRYWVSKEVSVFNWFDKNKPKKLVHKEIVPTPYNQSNKWNVKEDIFKKELQMSSTPLGISFALSALTSSSFATKTITPKPKFKLEDAHKYIPMKTQDEVVANTLWRTLQLRGFVDDDKHTLTPWGRALQSALSTLDPKDNLEESVYLGVELLRLGVLKHTNFAPAQSGAPSIGTDEDKVHTLLVSRVASLVPISHNPIGYTGPLSRNLLGFNSFIVTLTRQLRVFVEMVLASLLMYRDAEIDSVDWLDLAQRLPFIDEVNAGLGIAVKTYLDELSGTDDPTSEFTRSDQKHKLDSMFAQAKDIHSDLEMAFKVWDAIMAGIKILQEEKLMLTETKPFLAAHQWLAVRR